MKGPMHEGSRRAAGLALVAGLMAATLPAAPAIAADVVTLPPCSQTEPGDGRIVSPWGSILDADGEVVEHRMTLRRDGVDTVVQTSWRGFATPVGDTRILIGERSDEGTRLTMVDVPGACREWDRSIDRLAYDVTALPEETSIRLALHEPATRLHEGFLVIDVASGVTQAVVGGDCGSSCEPNDGDVPPAAFIPAGPPRPVPAFAAGAWPRDHPLPFSWQSGQAPPAWARPVLKTAAGDSLRTSKARTPGFRFSSSASDSLRYTSIFPSFCRYGIACASRAMPSWWAVWIRPHGTDFSWGRLRWCQKQNTAGCFDLRRVALHELGHVSGLDHPSNAGFRLSARDTVMQAITPARPNPGSSRHAYGPCDVATLQGLYDVPDKRTLISTCHDLATSLKLSADSTSVQRGESVRLRAVLRIADRSGYGRLANNPLAGRSVKLKFRRAGSDGAWSTAWMEPVPGTARYKSTITPQATWEFKAAFPRPGDEGLRFSSSAILKVKVKD